MSLPMKKKRSEVLRDGIVADGEAGGETAVEGGEKLTERDLG